jgi:protein-S-isoprenylcysteine O-methyltransferase Ste14
VQFIPNLGEVGVFLHTDIIIIVRIKNEEKVLEEKLEGYKEYEEKVKYRIIPFIF